MRLFGGIDIGSRTIGLVLTSGGAAMHQQVISCGPRPIAAAEALLAESLTRLGAERSALARTVATGYGRNYFPGADATAPEITCQALGVSQLLPYVTTIIDIGGQDAKVIWVGQDGKVVDFAMNDRCAAGTGRFLEMAAQLVGVAIEEFGALAVSAPDAVEISSMCAVFAESEIIGLLQSQAAVPSVLRGVCRAVAGRTLTLASRQPFSGNLAFTGGVALNEGVVAELRRQTKVNVLVPPHPQITGALGAALMASRDTQVEVSGPSVS